MSIQDLIAKVAGQVLSRSRDIRTDATVLHRKVPVFKVSQELKDMVAPELSHYGHARSDGRIVEDELEIVSSPEAKSHYADLQRLADEGMIGTRR